MKKKTTCFVSILRASGRCLAVSCSCCAGRVGNRDTTLKANGVELQPNLRSTRQKSWKGRGTSAKGWKSSNEKSEEDEKLDGKSLKYDKLEESRGDVEGRREV